MGSEIQVGRRAFLAGGGALAASLPMSVEAAGKRDPYEGAGDTPFTVGQPCLQAPAETTMGISWAISGLAKGEVEYADNPEFKHSKRVKCGGFGLVPIDIQALNVRLEGLNPSTKYWYRTITVPFTDYRNIYDAKLGKSIEGTVHSFVTMGPKTPARICFFSDTHGQWGACQAYAGMLKKLNPSLAVWNGDATNTTQHKETAVEIFLNPPIVDKDFTADIPCCFESGNHDFRGSWISKKEEVVMPRHPTERLPCEWDLKWNFAIRVGDIALIGMDTGEDKPDEHPKWFGLANFSPYRKAQATWLERTLKRADIAKAKFKVMVCHIPLLGVLEGDDDGTKVTPHGYAKWSRECRELWGELLERNGVQLVVGGHRHFYSHIKPTKGRSWHQLVCGGHEKGGLPNERTLVELMAEDGALKFKAYELWSGKILEEGLIARG